MVKLCGSTCNPAPGEDPELKLEVSIMTWIPVKLEITKSYSKLITRILKNSKSKIFYKEALKTPKKIFYCIVFALVFALYRVIIFIIYLFIYLVIYLFIYLFIIYLFIYQFIYFKRDLSYID